MTSALEDIKTIDLEEWLTLNTAAAASKLPQGQTPNCNNVWTDEKPGSVMTANGFIKVGTSPSGNPTTFCTDYFKSSSGDQLFILSDNQKVWKTTDFQNFTELVTGLSSSFQLRGKIIRDKLWLTNGSDSVRTYDGTNVVVLDGSGGTPNVPKGRYIDYYDERVWMFHLPSDRSNCRFTTLTDNTGVAIAPDNASAWPSSNALQVSEGDADFGTGLLIYRGFLHFFKQYSIWRLVGFDEYTYSRVKTRSSTGTRFNESIQVLDSLVHFIGTDGIYVFDGEESDRISDIIDPAAASQTAFGFNQLQQPNTNNTFWETTDTAEWNAGAVPANVTVDDSLTFKAADDVTADFVAGNTLTNVTASDIADELILAITTTGRSNRNVALDAICTIVPLSGTGVVGVGAYMTDGGSTNACGFTGSPSNASGALNLALSSTLHLTTIILRNVVAQFAQMTVKVAGSVITPSAVTGGPVIAGSSINWPAYSGTPTDVTITFPAFSPTDLQLVLALIPSNTSFTLTEVEVYTGAYNATGSFISKTLDLGAIPNSLGNFNADTTLPAGTTLTFYTQSSADGSSWDAAVACTNGGAIGSTIRRYLRWRADYTSDGTDTPVISAVYLPTQYISAVHNTGGSIYAWGPVESERSYFGQDINFYYRTATTSLGVAGATWNLIVPGGVISDAVANQYVQFKIEILGGTASQLPNIVSVTINWVVGTGTQPNTLQNVASAAWRNRYWLAAAGPGATSNDTILVRGKKSFKSPWMLKDWPILSFCRFQDNFYGGSSVDGSIYRLDTGFSKDGDAMDSFFETGDFTFGGFFAYLDEILIEVERLGSYTLAVGVSIDGGNTWTEKNVDLTVTTGPASFVKRLNFRLMGDKIRFRVRTNASDQPFQVHRMIAYYSISKQRGSIN